MTPEERLRNLMAGARGDEPVTESEWESFATSARRSVRIQRMVAGAVALLILGVAMVGGAALFGDFGTEDRVVPPAGSETPEGCKDIDAPSDPEACNYDPDAVSAPPISPSTQPSGFEEEPPPPLVETEIWLVDPKTDTLSWGTRLVPVGEADRSDPLWRALRALLDGPLASDTEIGITTEIPKGTRLLDVRISGGIATIDLSSTFDERGEASKSSLLLREAQLVYTATQFEEVDFVEIRIEGNLYVGSTDVLPYGRGMSEYESIEPPIVVDTPKPGTSVTEPTLTVTGRADVFEGTVTIRLVIPGPGSDQRASVTYATATCGSGCRGTFEKEMMFPDNIEEPTEAVLRVFEVSAEDGSRLHQISLPLTLLPD